MQKKLKLVLLMTLRARANDGARFKNLLEILNFYFNFMQLSVRLNVGKKKYLKLIRKEKGRRIRRQE